MTELLTKFKQKRDEIGATELAKRLGIAASAVRMVSTGNYPNPSHILSNFAAQFIDPECPFTDEKITYDDCNAHAYGNRPAGGHTRQAWWDKCQDCPYKGKRTTVERNAHD